MLTIEDIENVTFRKAGLGGGYRIDDVDEFVDKVVESVRKLELENRELRSRIDAQEKDIIEYKEKEESVQKAIISAEMTAKQIVMDATMKSESRLSDSKETGEKLVREAHEKADKILRDAQERADKLNADTDARVDELMNKALAESSQKIEENNEILEQQKKNIIRLMGEANKFRNSLLQSYKEHLKVINSMSKSDDFKKQTKEMDKNYPPMHGNAPVASARPDPVVSETEEKDDEPDCPQQDQVESSTENTVIAESTGNIQEADEPVVSAVTTEEEEADASEVTSETAEAETGVVSEDNGSVEDAVSEDAVAEGSVSDASENTDEGVSFVSGAIEVEESEVRINRQPIVFETSSPETVSGMLKVEESTPEEEQNFRSKKNKHKKRR